MFDVLGFWGMVSLMVVPAPLLMIHGYMQRLYSILKSEGLKPSEKSILTRNMSLPVGYYVTLFCATVCQAGLAAITGLMCLRSGDSFLSVLANVAEKLAPFGGFIFSVVAIACVVYFGERLAIKIARVTVALDKLSDK